MQKVFVIVMMVLALAACAPDPQISQAQADAIRMRAMTDAALQMQQANQVPPATQGIPWMILAFTWMTIVIVLTSAFLFYVFRVRPTRQAYRAQIERVVERQLIVMVTQTPRGAWIAQDSGAHTLATAESLPKLMEAINER